MKKYLLVYTLLLIMVAAFAQTKPKPKEKSLSEMDKAMEDAMKGMSEEEKVEMRKMMKDMMPEMAKKPGSDVSFTDNKKLIPLKDVKRINSISKKIFTDADVTANTSLLYSKLMAKISPSEKTIITNVLAKTKKGSALMEAALTSFLQGHNQAAMGLALKAVQAEPKNVTSQNNLAAILSQSGYPEKAIPYLKKLSRQFPTNGTVLHNLGYAWLSLGEIDTARRFFAYAAIRNPSNPETKLCRGLIEELKGDPIKAGENYAESFEQVPNPFAESLAKNVQAEGRLEKIDFDKLKNRIAIHEYFKKDWIKIPKLVDSVNAYEANMRIKNGYDKMFEELDNRIEGALEASGAEVDALVAKGEAEFVKTMARETQKGLNVMSMPAVYIQKILQAHIHKWNENYVREYQALKEEIQAQKIILTKAGKNDKCPDFDRKNDAFLSYANPILRRFHAKKIEECRVWMNAFCTWSWYIAGNPKNVVLTQCITWTAYITGLYKEAVESQYAEAKSCVKQDGDGIADVPVPRIPNFTCPTVVSIPIGMDELRLSAETVNFDSNRWNIKQAEGSQIPNITLSLGIGDLHITEPGKYGNPFMKTGNGSANTSGANDDAELTPLKKIMDELTPLSKLPLDELAPLDPSLLDKKKLGKAEAEKILRAKATRKILKDLMQSKCPGKLTNPIIYQDETRTVFADGFEVGLGKLELEPIFEVGLGELVLEEPFADVDLSKLELWDDDMQAWINPKGEKRYEEGFKEKLIKDVGEALRTSGLQTTISNGLEGIKTMSNADRGLFD